MIERTTGNKIMFVIYKFVRTFYVSVFYYFMPFTAIIMSTMVPLAFRHFFIYELPACN